MEESLSNKGFISAASKDVEEMAICDQAVVFIHNTGKNSKITIYNMENGVVKSISMMGLVCFNTHAYEDMVIFEYSGDRRGIGILCVKTLEIKELDCGISHIILGGYWENYIVLRRESEVVLLNINNMEERVISNYHHALGFPIIGDGYCAWFQGCRGKKYIAIYNIMDESSLFLTVPGSISKIYIIDGCIVYQRCLNNKCGIFSYNISNGQLELIYESSNWVELYEGKEGTLVWTVRRERQGRYVFDIFTYFMSVKKMVKVLSDTESIVALAASKKLLMWANENIRGDHVYFIKTPIQN